jgi:hypothetical protein
VTIGLQNWYNKANIMDSQIEKTPSLHLPQPSEGRGKVFANPVEHPPFSSETNTLSGEFATQATTTPPPLAVANDPAIAGLPVPLTASPDPAGTGTTSSTDDNKLDEEWINKAKMIVEQTHTDPFRESHEISRVKADYLKTRYNKVIKVIEDQGQ